MLPHSMPRSPLHQVTKEVTTLSHRKRQKTIVNQSTERAASDINS